MLINYVSSEFGRQWEEKPDGLSPQKNFSWGKIIGRKEFQNELASLLQAHDLASILAIVNHFMSSLPSYIWGEILQ
jgi:hypothetical protein